MGKSVFTASPVKEECQSVSLHGSWPYFLLALLCGCAGVSLSDESSESLLLSSAAVAARDAAVVAFHHCCGGACTRPRRDLGRPSVPGLLDVESRERFRERELSELSSRRARFLGG